MDASPSLATRTLQPLRGVSRVFRWSNAKQQPVGPFPRDVWQLLLHHLPRRALLRMLATHPLFHVLVEKSDALRARVQMCYFASACKDANVVVLEQAVACSANDLPKGAIGRLDDSSRGPIAFLRRSHVVSNHYEGRGFGSGMVLVPNNSSSRMDYQRVTFRMLSDMKTENYVSYFNFTICAGKNPRGATDALHYFVDGDVWDVRHNWGKDARNAARWEQGDLITVEVFVGSLEDFTGCALSHKKEVQKEGSQERHEFLKPAAVLSQSDWDQNKRVFVCFYRNRRALFQPILIQECEVGIPAWVYVKFVELKDCVEIVPDDELFKTE